MRYDGKQSEAAKYRSNADTLVQRLVAWRHFVHECRECQREIALLWPLCTACELRLSTRCPGCDNPLPPVGAYGCPCCGLAMP